MSTPLSGTNNVFSEVHLALINKKTTFKFYVSNQPVFSMNSIKCKHHFIVATIQ